MLSLLSRTPKKTWHTRTDLDRQDFEAWLRSQPPHSTVGWGAAGYHESNDSPFEMYYKSMGFRKTSQGTKHITIDGDRKELPTWAVFFLEWVDGVETFAREVTALKALKYLDRVDKNKAKWDIESNT